MFVVKSSCTASIRDACTTCSSVCARPAHMPVPQAKAGSRLLPQWLPTFFLTEPSQLTSGLGWLTLNHPLTSWSYRHLLRLASSCLSF